MFTATETEHLQVIDHIRQYRKYSRYTEILDYHKIVDNPNERYWTFVHNADEYWDMAKAAENEIEWDILQFGADYVQSCVREIENRNLKSWRVAQRVISWNSKYCFFGTLTFTDEVLEKTSPATRRQYVSRYLSAISSRYIANIDFGKNTDREHYHFIIDTPPVKWQYGFMNSKRFPVHDRKKVSNYILKYGFHSTKKNSRLIYGKS